MRPLLFVISGFMPGVGAFDWLQAELPEAEVVTKDLPGFNTGILKGVEPGPETTAAAFREMLPEGRRTIVLGVSTGCLPALHMASEELILVEPFLKPMEVWTLRAFLAQIVAERPHHALLRRMILGYFGAFTAGRDFSPLLELAPAKTTVIVGETPLGEPRKFSVYPSMTSEVEREAWVAKGAKLIVAPGAGHDVPTQARSFFIEEVRRALR